MQLLCKSKTNSILFCSELYKKGFPDSSVGKEPACNAGDPSSIPRLGRSAGEGIGYPLQYSWASLVAQLVKIHLQCGRPGFDPWVGKIPWRRQRLPTPVFWPGQFHGLDNSMDHGGLKELDTTERLSLSFYKKLLTDSEADVRKNNEAPLI